MYQATCGTGGNKGFTITTITTQVTKALTFLFSHLFGVQIACNFKFRTCHNPTYETTMHLTYPSITCCLKVP